MSRTDTSLSLTPPSKMNIWERIGQTLAGIGILSLLVTFLGTKIAPYLSLGIGLCCLVAAGVLLTKNSVQYKKLILILALSGLVALILMGLVHLGIIDLANVKKSVEIQPGDWQAKPLAAFYWVLAFIIFGGISIGGILYFYGAFGKAPSGIKNNGNMHSEATKKHGSIAWILTITFTGFYILLYWFPENLNGLIETVKPLKIALTGNDYSAQWFLYGLIYSLAVLVMGVRFIFKYRHNRYQIVRTLSVTFFQLIIAFALPNFLEKLNTTQSNEYNQSEVLAAYKPIAESYKNAYTEYNAAKEALQTAKDNGNATTGEEARLKERKEVLENAIGAALPYQDEIRQATPQVTAHYFSYFWPLDYDLLWPETINYYTGESPENNVIIPYETKTGFGSFGWWVIGIGAFLSLVGMVILTYFFGKRWYCSWVCGCGGLAETAGDPFRHLSDKSLKAWRIERVLIHSVLVLITAITIVLLLDWKIGFLGEGLSSGLKKGYGFIIGQAFAGVIGTGFYPIMGSRVWCRFGCPQAAILGILQKYFSRFRITTNGGQCISCGNCSTYCEMGIDVKWYAQRGENIVRASCVGCGICSAVCPRGVLNLENGSKENRYNGEQPTVIT